MKERTLDARSLRAEATKALRSFRDREARISSKPEIIPTGLETLWQKNIGEGKSLIQDARDAIRAKDFTQASALLTIAKRLQKDMRLQSFDWQYELTSPQPVAQKQPTEQQLHPWWQHITESIKRFLDRLRPKRLPAFPRPRLLLSPFSSVHQPPQRRRDVLGLLAKTMGKAAVIAATGKIGLETRAETAEANRSSEKKSLTALSLIFPKKTTVYTLYDKWNSRKMRNGGWEVRIPRHAVAGKYFGLFHPGTRLHYEAITHDETGLIATEGNMRLTPSGRLEFQSPDNTTGRYRPVAVELQIVNTQNRALYDAAVRFDGSEKVAHSDVWGKTPSIAGVFLRDTQRPSTAYITITKPNGDLIYKRIRVRGGQMIQKKIEVDTQVEERELSAARFHLARTLRSVRGMDAARIRGAMDLFNHAGDKGPEVGAYLVQIAETFARLGYPQPSTKEVQEILGHYSSVSKVRGGEDGELLRSIVQEFVTKHLKNIPM